MGLNDAAWEKLFEKYNILDEVEKNGQFVISARQIKEYREPRLMTKFDHKVNLPSVFEKNDLSILPISRGDYIISSFSAYQELADPGKDIQKVNIPQHLQTLAPEFLVSESISLNCAKGCSILDDFLDDNDLVSTVSGRMGSGAFDFDIETAIGTKSVKVNNSQIEIDAAFEGLNYLSLFEAKRELADDFLIRQLYYPFRTWKDRVTKPIKPIFFVFSNGIFNLYQYQFEDPMNYNSLVLVKQKNYVIDTEISCSDIEDLLNTVQIIKEPKIAFPQADSLYRVINLIELLYEKPMTKQDVTSEYGFNERQTNYYADAGRYLGLIEKYDDEEGKKTYKLSALGEKIMGLPYKERQLKIVTQILQHEVFNETLKIHLKCGEMPDKSQIVKLMKKADIYRVEAESTFERRSSTVSSWTNWILGIIDN